MFLSALIIVLAIIVLRKQGYSRWLPWGLSLTILLFVALTGIEIGLNSITGEGVNAAVIYHMTTGLGGGDISQYYGVIAAGLLALLGACAALWYARDWLRPKLDIRKWYWDSGIVLMLLAALAVHPVPRASAAYALRFSVVEQNVEGYHHPQLAPNRPESPKNLVLVYLESLERTYMDKERFPGLTPYLSELEGRAITFTDMGQTVGTTFTVGGMVATQCGVPLILSGGGGNSMRVTQFLSGANCLGDILGEAEYTLSYLGGASIEFAGKGAFFQSHGYDEITGRDELVPLLNDPAYLTEWGLQDDTLFDLARERFERLAAGERPFVLSLLTLDTHPPYGHADTNRACAGMQYGDGSNPSLNAVLCDDFLAGQFIEEILSGPHAEDTVIAVMSDHLAMGNTATDQLNAGPRRNLMMIIDPATATSPQAMSRPATTLDIGPTLLSYLGFDMPMMGFGVDLLGAAPTIPEKLAVAADDTRALDAHLMGYQSVYNRLWSLPDISDGLYVNLERSEANFGDFGFPVPTLLAFDENYTITEISLSNDPAFNRSLTEIMMDLPEGTSYMWFDDCNALGELRPREALGQQAGLCLATGRRMMSADVRSLPRSTFLSKEDLATMLSAPQDPNAPPENEALTRIGILRGDLPQELTLPGLLTGEQRILLQSAAFGAGASLVRRLTTDSLDTGQEWILDRGLHLVGISADGRTEPLDRMDQCTPGFDVGAHRPWAELIADSRTRFVAHAILVQDTAFCGQASAQLAPALQGIELPVLQALEARQAYIGLIDASGAVREFGNSVFPRVRLLLTPQRSVDTTSEVAPAPILTPDRVAVAQSEVAPESVTNPTPVVAAVKPRSQHTEPELTGCIAPDALTEPAPQTALLRNSRIADNALTGPIGFSSGWWSQEPAGRWSGAREVAFTIVLPNTDKGLTLTLDLVSPERRTVSLNYDGVELASRPIFGKSEFIVEIGALPRGVPVTLNLSIDGPALSCPTVLGSGSDARQMGVMLQAVMLSDSEGIVEPQVLATAPAALGLAAEASAVRLEGCIGPEQGAEARSALISMPLSRVLPIAEAETTAIIGFGAGWWAPEVFGRWMGDREAEITLILPDAPDDLMLAMSAGVFGADLIDLALSLDGQQIHRQKIGVNNPFLANVSQLPRGEVLRLIFTLPNGQLGCPAVRDGTSDQRSLGLMIQSLRLSPGNAAPFGLSIGLGGGRVNEQVASNSFNALMANKDRFDVFELDLDWTADGELVCIDNWQQSFETRFGAQITAPPSYDAFRKLLAGSPAEPRNCTLDGLAGWLRGNPNIRIVTDVTEELVPAHALIAASHPDLLAQFVPMAALAEQITALRDLGFVEVVFAPDFSVIGIETLIADARAQFPTAIALPLDAAQEGALQAITDATSLPVYVRSSNDPDQVACLLTQGASGIFSDDLGLAQVDALRTNIADCN